MGCSGFSGWKLILGRESGNEKGDAKRVPFFDQNNWIVTGLVGVKESGVT